MKKFIYFVLIIGIFVGDICGNRFGLYSDEYYGIILCIISTIIFIYRRQILQFLGWDDKDYGVPKKVNVYYNNSRAIAYFGSVWLTVRFKNLTEYRIKYIHFDICLINAVDDVIGIMNCSKSEYIEPGNKSVNNNSGYSFYDPDIYRFMVENVCIVTSDGDEIFIDNAELDHIG